MTKAVNNKKIFAGIGSRETPAGILQDMAVIAKKLDSQGYMCASGGARGADTAFEEAMEPGKTKVFLAGHATKNAIEMASRYHPAWDKCKDYTKKLHGRNAMIILGINLDSPVEFVLCWTPHGRVQGGTGLGIKIAVAHDIPVFNLGNPRWKEEVGKWKQDPDNYVQWVNSDDFKDEDEERGNDLKKEFQERFSEEDRNWLQEQGFTIPE